MHNNEDNEGGTENVVQLRPEIAHGSPEAIAEAYELMQAFSTLKKPKHRALLVQTAKMFRMNELCERYAPDEVAAKVNQDVLDFEAKRNALLNEAKPTQ